VAQSGWQQFSGTRRLGAVRNGLSQMEENHYDDVEAEVDADFAIFRNQLVSQLACKWQAREVEWLERGRARSCMPPFQHTVNV
jgi:hypothetical protein